MYVPIGQERDRDGVGSLGVNLQVNTGGLILH